MVLPADGYEMLAVEVAGVMKSRLIMRRINSVYEYLPDVNVGSTYRFEVSDLDKDKEVLLIILMLLGLICTLFICQRS